MPKRREPATAAGSALRVLEAHAKDEEGDAMLARHFDAFKEFMDDALATGGSATRSSGGAGNGSAGNGIIAASPRVLVHCVAGMNHSGVLAVAYVIGANRWPLLKALRHCLEARGCMLWNDSFQKQLALFAQREGLLVVDGDDGRR